MKHYILAALLTALVGVMPATAQGNPNLERGKTFIDVPAMSDGLCVSNLFQSHMVLQRDKPITIWGWAAPGETVTVLWGGQEAKTTAAEDRSWTILLPAMKANATGQTLTIKEKNKTLIFDDILIGDVWVLGGQSNMQHPLSRVEDGAMEIVSAHFPNIRLLTVPALIDNREKQNFPKVYRWENGHHREGYWDVCSPTTVGEFSGIGYIFARRIHMASQVPIGVIDASRWGTTVEAWTPLEVLRKIDTRAVKTWLAEWDRKVADYDPQVALEARIKHYNDRTERLREEGTDVSQRTPPTEPPPSPLVNQNHPGNCYASIIAPLAGFAVRGAIYHQGFNNSRADADEFYYQVFPRMIAAWRETFTDPEMAFGIISLCTDSAPQTLTNYTECMTNFGIYVREAQYKTFLDLYRAGDQNIGFASSFDLRRAWYHPQKKIPAGERIARWALATQYGFQGRVHWKPPMVTKMEVKEGKILVHVDNEVAAADPQAAIVGFAIAGADKRFHPATADCLIVGKDGRGRPQYDRKVVVLSSPHVPQPVHYRYAWGRNPMGNLQIAHTNQKDIPFATQRSDKWTMADLYAAYIGKPVPDPAAGLNRRDQQALKKALQQADLDRRLIDAKALLEKHPSKQEDLEK